MPDETLEIEYTLNIQTAMKNLETVQGRANQIAAQLRQLASQSNVALNDIASSMKKSFAEGATKTGLKPTPEEIKEYGTAMSVALKQVRDEEKKVIDNTTKLGSVLKFVFSGLLGLSIIGALRSLFTSITGYIKDATKYALDYQKSILKLSISVQQLRKVGMNITFKEAIEQAQQLRKEFGTLSTAEAVDAIASIQLLTRNFGFSKDQMKEVADAALVIATVTGKDFNEAARETALFLSSGYAEAMQRAGFAVNRLSVQEEAAAIGIDKSYIAMTEKERAAAALSLINKQLGGSVDEVVKAQDTLSGAVKASESTFKDVKNYIGNEVLPVWVTLIEFLGKAGEGFLKLTSKTSKISSVMEEFTVSVVRAWLQIGAAIDKPILKIGVFFELLSRKISFKDALAQLKAIDEEESKILDKWEQTVRKRFAQARGENPLEESPLGNPEDVLKEEEASKALQNLVDEMYEIEQDYTEDSKNLWDKYQQDIADINEEHRQKQLELEQDYQDRLAEIAKQSQFDVIDAQRKLSQNIEDLNRDTQYKLEDAQQKYREEELKAERDYQEKLRRLREEFLFDLEDALRERDALQVLRLIRRYNLDKEQLERQTEEEKQQRQEKLDNEIADIQLAKERRLEELQIEHQRRLEEINIQAEREREEARINRDKALAEEEEAWQQKQLERGLQYEQEVADLQNNLLNKITDAITSWLKQNEEITGQYATAIGNALAATFGPGGTAESQFNYFSGMIQNATQQAIDAINQMQKMEAQVASQSKGYSPTWPTTPTGGYQHPSNYGMPSYAEGGTLIARKPTVALFGEKSPEIATFTPISKLSSSNGVPQLGSAMGANGKVKIELYLSPDLEARIVDTSLDQAAGVFAEIMRTR